MLARFSLCYHSMSDPMHYAAACCAFMCIPISFRILSHTHTKSAHCVCHSRELKCFDTSALVLVDVVAASPLPVPHAVLFHPVHAWLFDTTRP